MNLPCLEGMKEQNEEIDAIVNNPETPTFQNTIVALEKSGALLDRVTTVFGNLMSAETSDENAGIGRKNDARTVRTQQQHQSE